MSKKREPKTKLTSVRIKINLLEKALKINSCKTDFINDGIKLYIEKFEK